MHAVILGRGQQQLHLPPIPSFTCFSFLWFMLPAGRSGGGGGVGGVTGTSQPTFDYELFPSISLTQAGMH